MTELVKRLSDVLSPGRVADYLVEVLLPNAIVAIAVAVVFWVVWRLLRSGLEAVLARSEIDATAQAFVITVGRYVVVTIGGVTALGQLGVNMGSVLASLGVAGLSIGFAAKDALSNIISGLFIFWDRPFVIGDLVEIGSAYGRVDQITMRSTRVVTPDGRMLAIPNSEVVNSTVASYTNFPHLRLQIPMTIAVDEDIDRARAAMLAVVKGDERYQAEPAPRVVLTETGDYNVTVELQAWLTDERDHVAARHELRETVYQTLLSTGVNMPYQTFEVHQQAA